MPRTLLMGIVIGLTVLVHVALLTYILRYTPTYPLPIDDWVSSLPVVEAAQAGTNPTAAILKPVNFIHTHVPTHTTTYLLAVFTNWNLLAGSLLNYALALCNLGLLLILFTREDHALGLYLLLLLTVLVLAP